MLVYKVPRSAILIDGVMTGRRWARSSLDPTEGGHKLLCVALEMELDFEWRLLQARAQAPNKNACVCVCVSECVRECE